MNNQYRVDDRCIVCGAPVPEGRFVCWSCENFKVDETRKKTFGSRKRGRIIPFHLYRQLRNKGNYLKSK